MSTTMVFANRLDAGHQLGMTLERFSTSHPLILATSDGGVIVASVVAHLLHARLDVLDASGPHPALLGRLVILINDEAGSAGTLAAAIHTARSSGADRVVVAVPVASPEALVDLRLLADDVVCLQESRGFSEVEHYYDDTNHIDDHTVLTYLRGGFVREVSIATTDSGGLQHLPARLTVPQGSERLVIFTCQATGERDARIADVLQESGVSTLRCDVVTTGEQDYAGVTRRLESVIAWARGAEATWRMGLGLMGDGVGGAAALIAAARHHSAVQAVATHSARTDLATAWLSSVLAPTLLIVGSEDVDRLRIQRQDLARMTCRAELAIVPTAHAEFDEPGTLYRVAALARDWFQRELHGLPA